MQVTKIEVGLALTIVMTDCVCGRAHNDIHENSHRQNLCVPKIKIDIFFTSHAEGHKGVHVIMSMDCGKNFSLQ